MRKILYLTLKLSPLIIDFIKTAENILGKILIISMRIADYYNPIKTFA